MCLFLLHMIKMKEEEEEEEEDQLQLKGLNNTGEVEVIVLYE